MNENSMLLTMKLLTLSCWGNMTIVFFPILSCIRLEFVILHTYLGEKDRSSTQYYQNTNLPKAACHNCNNQNQHTTKCSPKNCTQIKFLAWKKESNWKLPIQKLISRRICFALFKFEAHMSDLTITARCSSCFSISCDTIWAGNTSIVSSCGLDKICWSFFTTACCSSKSCFAH